MSRSLYFIAIVLPEPVSEQVRRFQQYSADHFNSRRALRSPPHITLVAPFRLGDDHITPLANSLTDLTARWLRFDIHLQSFDHFRNRVIFVHVCDNPVLTSIATALQDQLSEAGYPVKVETRPFHPHVTIAFKDLGRAEFAPAWEHFSNTGYSAVCSVDALALLRHRDHAWQVIRTFPLGRKDA